jgi:hypothetical protein
MVFKLWSVAEVTHPNYPSPIAQEVSIGFTKMIFYPLQLQMHCMQMEDFRKTVSSVVRKSSH